MKVFEYVVFWNKKLTKKEQEEGVNEEGRILVGPVVLVAKDVTQVQILAARSIPDEYTKKLEEVEIAIRPF